MAATLVLRSGADVFFAPKGRPKTESVAHVGVVNGFLRVITDPFKLCRNWSTHFDYGNYSYEQRLETLHNNVLSQRLLLQTVYLWTPDDDQRLGLSFQIFTILAVDAQAGTVTVLVHDDVDLFEWEEGDHPCEPFDPRWAKKT